MRGPFISLTVSLTVSVTVIVAFPRTASAEIRIHPDAVHRPATDRMGRIAVWTERTGTGEIPHEADEVRYRIEHYWDRVGPAEVDERTEHLSAVPRNEVVHADLLAMRVGERRWFWGVMQNSNHCDHFGCGPPQRFATLLEVLEVTSHHDALPGDLRIAAHPFRVVDGARSALLPADPVSHLEEVRLDGDHVAITVAFRPYGRTTLTFTLAELRARLAVAEAQTQRRRGDLAGAASSVARALASDATLDDAHLELAAVLAARNQPALADEALAPIATRNPVWLVWKLHTDRALTPLLRSPVIRALVASPDAAPPMPMPIDDRELVLELLSEPTGRYLAVHVTPTYGGNALRIVDRASGRIVTSLPVSCERYFSDDARRERCLVATPAGRTLAYLGFGLASATVLRADRQLQKSALGGLVISRSRITSGLRGPASDVEVALRTPQVLPPDPDPPAADPARPSAWDATPPSPATTTTAPPPGPKSSRSWPLLLLALLGLLDLACVRRLSTISH